MAMVDSELLDELLGTLDTRARYAVEARFGLIDGERKSFREVGEELGVTAEAARRLVKPGRRRPPRRRRDASSPPESPVRRRTPTSRSPTRSGAARKSASLSSFRRR